MNRFPYTPELKPFQVADDAWSAELVRVFGKNAGDARYTDKGKSTPELKRLHDIRDAAQSAWHRSAYRQPVTACGREG